RGHVLRFDTETRCDELLQCGNIDWRIARECRIPGFAYGPCGCGVRAPQIRVVAQVDRARFAARVVRGERAILCAQQRRTALHDVVRCGERAATQPGRLRVRGQALRLCECDRRIREVGGAARAQLLVGSEP